MSGWGVTDLSGCSVTKNGFSSAKEMFATRKRHLVQQCISKVVGLVNNNAKGLQMRVQGHKEGSSAAVHSHGGADTSRY